jgi:predicted nucleic acid-binding protein
MNSFLLDSRALVHRYFPSPRTPLLDHLFARCAYQHLVCSVLEVADMVATLVRRQHQGLLTPVLLSAALLQVRLDVMQAPGILKLATENKTIEACFGLLETHRLGCLDGIFVQMARELAGGLRNRGDDLVVVTPKKRLLQVLHAEGLKTFDPETQSQADLDALLGP